MMRKQMGRSSKSPLVVFTVVLAALSLLFFILLSFRGFSDGPIHPNPVYKPETSFVASLERFLLLPHRCTTHTKRDDLDDDVERL